MRRISIGFATAATMAAMLVSAPSAAAQETLTASCEPPEDSTSLTGGFPVAQDFTAAASGNLSRAEVSLAQDGDVVQPFIVEIWTADTDGDPATPLAIGTIPSANVPDGTPALVGVAFTTAAPIVAGQRYAIVVRHEAAAKLGARVDVDCPGTARYSFPPYEEWTEDFFDVVFRVFVSVSPAAASTCKGEPATIVGTDGDNEITGTDERDVIAALGGNDDVRSLGANDLVCGGAGRDRLRGGEGKDKLLGQAGKDTLRGQKGKDRLLGKGGPDKLNGGAARDVCKGGKKDDTASKCEVERSI